MDFKFKSLECLTLGDATVAGGLYTTALGKNYLDGGNVFFFVESNIVDFLG